MNSHLLDLSLNEWYPHFESINETETRYDFEFYPDFDAAGATTITLGEGNEEPREVFISPRRHETIEELIQTIVHEGIHSAIYSLGIEMFDTKEHRIITKMQWIDEYV